MAALVWDKEAQAWTESNEVPMRWDTDSQARVKTAGYRNDGEAWTKVWTPEYNIDVKDLDSVGWTLTSTQSGGPLTSRGYNEDDGYYLFQIGNNWGSTNIHSFTTDIIPCLPGATVNYQLYFYTNNSGYYFTFKMYDANGNQIITKTLTSMGTVSLETVIPTSGFTMYGEVKAPTNWFGNVAIYSIG